MSKIKAIFFDRDGTIIKHVHYLSNPNEIELIPGVKRFLSFLKTNKIKLFLHTNQSGVERKFYKLEDVHNCNARMIELLDLEKDIFTKICIAPNLKKIKKNYRKPSTLFANEIMNEYDFSNLEVLYIGDSECDLQTAVNIGCTGFALNYNFNKFQKNFKKDKNIFFYKNWNEIYDVLKKQINDR